VQRVPERGVSSGITDKALEMAFEALHAEAAVEFMLGLFGVPDEITLEKKPALSARSFEIGETLAGDGYDLAALCEVWTTDVRDSLVDHWGIPRDSGHLGLGKLESNVYVGDGLLLGSREGRIVEVQRHHQPRILSVSGADLLADDELFAKRSTRLDMDGTVDLYLTAHRNWASGRAPWWFSSTPSTQRPRTSSSRSAQLTDLGNSSVATECGRVWRFQSDGTQTTPYAAAATVMTELSWLTAQCSGSERARIQGTGGISRSAAAQGG
jgi:hypothetical protein